MTIIIYLIGAVISYIILYWVIAGAVESGILAAHRIIRNTDDKFNEGENDGNRIRKIECPSCGTAHDMDYPKCPYCKHKYDSKAQTPDYFHNEL